MATAGELVCNDRDSRFHQEIIESLGRFEAKFDALLKVLVQVQANTSQIVRNTSINYENDEEKNKASPNPSSSSINPLHHSASTSSTLLTPQEDTITTTAATKNLAANEERPSTVNDNQEITQVTTDDRIDKSNGSHGMSKEVLDGYEELYEAALVGGWKVASKFLEKNPEAITKMITSESKTVLHVAMLSGNMMFIGEIVKLMPPEILEYKTKAECYTTLHYAALFGYAKAAKMMVTKNPKLTQIVDRSGKVPLHYALTSVTAGQRETVEYLYSVTRHEDPSPFSGYQGDTILRWTIDAGFYDIASSLVQRFPELVINQAKEVQTSAMTYMAERPFAFASGAKLTFWQRFIYSLVKVDIDTAYKLDTQTHENNSPHSSEKDLPQCVEGNIGDEENPDERFEGTYRDKEYPHEENMERDEAKPFKGEIFGESILVDICIICYKSYLMIKFYFVFLARFIWKP
ncbi:hypothetical protein MKX03_014554, partial [Papaver bracteatum]